MEELSLKKAFTLLESGPVVLITVNDGKRNNMMTISWHMVMDFHPHIALSTGPWNHSFHTMMETGECAICVPTVERISDVVQIGVTDGTKTDKFADFHFTPIPGEVVKAPLIQECLGCVECKVVDYIEKHGIVVLEGVKAWYHPQKQEKRTFHAVGNGSFLVDGECLDYRYLMEKWVPKGV